MFTLADSAFYRDLVISFPVADHLLRTSSMKYFDKDGYELNETEQLYYTRNRIPIGNHLYHVACQQDWIENEDDRGAVLDHSMLVMRFAYANEARDQIVHESLRQPLLRKLLQIQPKWGLDLSIDWVEYDSVDELLHLEVDRGSLEEIQEIRERIEQVVLNTDFRDAHAAFIRRKEEWVHLPSDDQSDWKARFFGFQRAFDNRKVL